MEDRASEWSRVEQESRGFREAARRILIGAGQGRTELELIGDISRTFLALTRCEALELWQRTADSSRGWASTRDSDGPTRLPVVPGQALDALLRGGVRVTETPAGTAAPDAYRSVARFPLRVGEETWGLLELQARAAGFFTRPMMDVLEDLSHVAAAALRHHRVHREERERVKELICLYRISQAMARVEVSVSDILREVAELLPAGWQYPELTTARILLDGEEHTSGEASTAPHRLASDIVIYGERRGFVEVACSAPGPERGEGAFLEEEQRLLDTVAQQIAYLVRRRRAESDRRQLSEQLRHADRLATIGQLSAGVAHELNEPLGGILGFAQLIRKNPGLDAQLDRDLGRIEAAALHARGVVRKLMLFARQTPPGRDQVDLNQVVQESLGLLESRCQETGIEVLRRLDPALPSIPADYGQLHQILVNLAVNALQAMPAGGQLTVETRAGEDHVSLIVSDTGHGMTDEVRRQVFDPFFTTKDVGEGTGLGLAVVHGIVLAHGGRIELESAVGQGSRFEVRLLLETPVHGNEEYD